MPVDPLSRDAIAANTSMPSRVDHTLTRVDSDADRAPPYFSCTSVGFLPSAFGGSVRRLRFVDGVSRGDGVWGALEDVVA